MEVCDAAADENEISASPLPEKKRVAFLYSACSLFTFISLKVEDKNAARPTVHYQPLLLATFSFPAKVLAGRVFGNTLSSIQIAF